MVREHTTLQVDAPERIGHWRPLVQWLLDVPRLVLLFCLSVASLVVAVLSWLAILATGQLPAGMARFQVLTLRYRERVYLHAKGLIGEAPPLAWAGTPVDPDDCPHVVVSVQPAAAGRNRLTTLVRWLLVFPTASPA